MTCHERTFVSQNSAGTHRVAYTEWGDPNNERVVFCVHGLTRNGRDFDYLARALQADFRVVCPDIVGRGKSDCLKNPLDYGYPQYIKDMLSLVEQVGGGKIYWVGTSMGGALGMAMAGLENSPITRLVMNDVGPFASRESLLHIKDYLGIASYFADAAAAESYFRRVYAPVGHLEPEQWRHLVDHGTKRLADGRLTLAYDFNIAAPYANADVEDVDLKPWWLKVKCPVLVLRGTQSEILLEKTAQYMLHNGPPTQLVEFPGIGHAPMLMNEAQIAPILEFLHAPITPS